MTPNTRRANPVLLMMSLNDNPYFFVIHVKKRLNEANIPLLGSSRCFSINPDIAGVSVRATIPEIVTEMTIVMANCL